MEHQGHTQSKHGLEAHGITNTNTVWWNLPTTALYESWSYEESTKL